MFTGVYMLVLLQGFLRFCTAIDEEYLLSEAKRYCPGANICYDNMTEKSPNIRTPCCADCWCGYNCKETRCCFQTNPSRDLHQLRPNQQCQYTIPLELTPEERIRYKSYYMVTESPADGCMESANHSHMAVEGIEANALKKFHPISSKTSRKIYNNLTLALCYGETDLIHWMSVLVCKKGTRSVLDIDVSIYLLFLLYPDQYPYCHTEFYYPGNEMDIVSKECFANIIDTCNSTTFDVPPETEFTRDDIKAACESDFFDPYTSLWATAIYANVFCSICNGYLPSNTAHCTVKHRSNILSFAWILETNIVEATNVEKADVIDAELACVTSNASEVDCRPLHCPSGKLRSETRACAWVFSEVGRRPIDVYVDLLPDKQLLIKDLLEHHTALVNPWSKMWKTVWVVYFPDPAESHTVKLVSVHFQVKTNQPHDVVLKAITKHMPKRWLLKFNGNVYEFEQRFSFQTIGEELFLQNAKVYYSFTNSSHTEIEPVQLIQLFLRPTFDKYALKITPLFYCEQIELSEDEFELNEQNDVMIIKRSNRHFLNLEFGLLEDSIGRLTARICLANSGFAKRPMASTSASSKGCSIIGIVACACFSILLK